MKNFLYINKKIILSLLLLCGFTVLPACSLFSPASTAGANQPGLDDFVNNDAAAEEQAAVTTAVAADNNQAEQAQTAAKSVLSYLQLEDEKGNAIDNKQYQDKILFTNFFTNSCQYCIRELKDLNKIYDNYKERQDFDFLLINIYADEADKKATADLFSNYDLKLPIVYINGRNAAQLGIRGVPVNFILDKQGDFLPVKLNEQTEPVKLFYGVQEKEMTYILNQVLENN